MSETQLSLSADAARNLATATVTVPQWDEITPRWLHKLLPWVDVDGGVFETKKPNPALTIVPRLLECPKCNEFGPFIFFEQADGLF